jgi:hypothetical protein
MNTVIIKEKVDIIEVDGIKYSRELFKHFAHHKNIGTCFKIMDNEKGSLTIRRVEKNENDLVKSLENKLNPEFMNSIFSWKNVKDKLEECLGEENESR